MNAFQTLRTKNRANFQLGRIKIESVLREMQNKISSGGGLGYGLHIIAAYYHKHRY